MKNQTASYLQNMHFECKSGVSFTNIQLSVTKITFQFTKWHLVLLLSQINNIVTAIASGFMQEEFKVKMDELKGKVERLS